MEETEPRSTCVTCITRDTSLDDCPLYVLVVEPRKLERILHSRLPWYVYKRSQFCRNDIGVASVLLNHPQLMFYRGTKDINTLYRQCRLLYGDILYIPVQTYTSIVMQMKIRAAVYLCQLMGVRSVRYRYNDDRKQSKQAEGAASGPMGSSANVSGAQEEGDGTDNRTVLSYPHVSTPYILCTPQELQSRVLSDEYHRGLMMCPQRIFAFADMQSLLSARLENHVTEVTLSLQEDAISTLDTRVIARVQSTWSGLVRYMMSRHKTMSIGMHIQFYPAPSLISLDALRHHSCFAPRHFPLVVQSRNMTLVDAFVRHHLSESRRLRYDLYKFLCPSDADDYLQSMAAFDSIEQDMVKFLDTLSFANLIPMDNNGLEKARSAASMVHRSLLSCGDNESIDASQLYRPLVSYLLRVHNGTRSTRGQTGSYLLPCAERYLRLYQLCRPVVDNLDHVPTYSVLESILEETLVHETTTTTEKS